MILSIITLFITALSKMTFSIITLCMTILSMMTISIIIKNDLNAVAECRGASAPWRQDLTTDLSELWLIQGIPKGEVTLYH
jgi:hypothetical protein